MYCSLLVFPTSPSLPSPLPLPLRAPWSTALSQCTALFPVPLHGPINRFLLSESRGHPIIPCLLSASLQSIPRQALTHGKPPSHSMNTHMKTEVTPQLSCSARAAILPPGLRPLEWSLVVCETKLGPLLCASCWHTGPRGAQGAPGLCGVGGKEEETVCTHHAFSEMPALYT